jgi:hypothetical protein
VAVDIISILQLHDLIMKNGIFFVLFITLIPLLVSCERSTDSRQNMALPCIYVDVGSYSPSFSDDNIDNYTGVGGEVYDGVTTILVDTTEIAQVETGGISFVLNEYIGDGRKNLIIESTSTSDLYLVIRYGDKENAISFFIDKRKLDNGFVSVSIPIHQIVDAAEKKLKSGDFGNALASFENTFRK